MTLRHYFGTACKNVVTRLGLPILIVLACGICLAQQPIRVRTHLVSVGFTARDAKGSLVDNLTESGVEVYEDGVQQKLAYFKRSIDALKGPAAQKAAANDAGDISWKVPMVKFYFPGSIPHVNFHHWAAGVPLATSIAHKGALAGAKVMAAAIVECLKNPEIVAEAKRTFRDEIKGVEYRPLLPAHQQPPVDLNRAMMEKYRPLMAKHYLKEKPAFR